MVKKKREEDPLAEIKRAIEMQEVLIWIMFLCLIAKIILMGAGSGG